MFLLQNRNKSEDFRCVTAVQNSIIGLLNEQKIMTKTASKQGQTTAQIGAANLLKRQTNQQHLHQQNRLKIGTFT